MKQTNTAMLLSHSTQFQEIIKSNPTVLVDFFATWCGPCKKLMPQLEKLHEEKKSFTFLKVDVDKHLQLVKTYQVKSLPTVILFKNGIKEESFTGSNSLEEIKRSFIKVLLENLTRVQGEIGNSSPNQRGKKSDYNEAVIKNITLKNYARYQYYIFLNNVLVKLKILSEDYYFIKKGYQIVENTDKEKKETIGMGSIDLKEQDFDLEKAKTYLGKILDTEDNIEIKKLEGLNNQMLKNIYSSL